MLLIQRPTKPLSRMQSLSESRGGGGGSKVTKPSFSNSATPGAKRYYYHLADSVLEPSLIKSALVYQCLYV